MTTDNANTRGPTLRFVCINDVYSLENLPRLKNLIRHHQTTEPADLFLTTLAGDFVGPSMLSSLDKGRGMIDSLNALGMTHVIFGNHEDDIGVEELRKRVTEFAGTWLNTNMPSFVPALPAQEILSVAAPGGRSVRVGLLGVVMEDATIYRRKPFGGAFIEPASAVALQMTARLLREEGCACVIPLTHQNFADDYRLAEAQAQAGPAYPLIIGGHEHKVFLEQVAGTWIVKAGIDASHAVIVDLLWPAAAPAGAPDLPTVRVRLEAVADYPEDVAVRVLVEERMKPVHELEAAVLMQVPPGAKLSSIGARMSQTSVGTLFCSRIRDALECEGCLLNGGGIRGGREYSERFTYGELKAELPFDNEVTAVLLPGRVIKEAILSSRAHAPVDSGGYLQVDDRMVVKEPEHLLLSIGGAPLEDDRVYRIAIMRELMTGMDHIEPLVRYAAVHPECIPPEGSGREIKVVLVDSFSAELWKKLGSFDSIDTNHDQTISESELAAAVERTTSAAASKVMVDLLMQTVDANADRAISRKEAAKLDKVCPSLKAGSES